MRQGGTEARRHEVKFGRDRDGGTKGWVSLYCSTALLLYSLAQRGEATPVAASPPGLKM
jgi:hypothetical protein